MRTLRVAAGVLALLVGACTGPTAPVASPATPSPVADATATGTPSPPATPSPTPKATPSPVPEPTTPVVTLPAELVGTWESDLSKFRESYCLECGKEVTLTLQEDGRYEILRGTSVARGPLSLDGDVIVFEGNNRCPLPAPYTWTVEADGLVVHSIKQEPCPNRAEALDGPTYTRVD
jgi:hypothetical protein